jgi:hypothetical protein
MGDTVHGRLNIPKTYKRATECLPFEILNSNRQKNSRLPAILPQNNKSHSLCLIMKYLAILSFVVALAAAQTCAQKADALGTQCVVSMSAKST